MITLEIAAVPTLEQFIQSYDSDSGFPRNAYVKFESMSSYHHIGPRAVDGTVYKRVLTRSNTTNKKRRANVETNPKARRTGMYKRLDDHSVELCKKYGLDGIYVESVLNDFLPEVLIRYGYKEVNRGLGAPNFFKRVNP